MIHPRRFITLVFFLFAALLSVGFVHGLWTDRWASMNGGFDVVEMENLPFSLGAWEGKADQDSATQTGIADPDYMLRRRYVNQNDGTVASILLVRGRPGPMVIKHLPTECYICAGYDLVGQPKRFVCRSADRKTSDGFWVATFKKTTDVFPMTLRVYWSWSATGQWQTPDRPRFAFAHHSTLYKLYVVQAIRDENEEFEGAPVHDLIAELTNAMRQTLFSSAHR